jgi:predicted transcriptional regulator
MKLKSATVRLSKNKRDILKTIAALEKRSLSEIISELVDEYIARHQETLEILSHPEWVEMIRKGEREIEKGEYTTLDDLENNLIKRKRKISKKD